MITGDARTGQAAPPAPVPLRDQIACVARECALRRNVYGRWVARGTMHQDEADKEVQRMEAVLATLQEVELGAAGEPA